MFQSIASSKDLAAFFANVLSTTVDNSTVIEVTTDSSTDSTEETTDSTTDSTTASSSSDSSSSDSFVQDLLNVHNEYRTLHGVANLTLNSTVSRYRPYYKYSCRKAAAILSGLSLKNERESSDNLFDVWRSSAFIQVKVDVS